MIEVKYSTKVPEIYFECKKRFGVEWTRGVIFTVGDTIHCIAKIPPDLEVHEKTHVRQQAEMGVKEWWDKYLDDPAFRLSQEVEAYRNQIKFLMKDMKDRNARAKRIHHITLGLSGPMYGNLVTYSEASKLLKI